MNEISYFHGGKTVYYKGCHFRTADVPEEISGDEEKFRKYLDDRIMARQTPQAIDVMVKSALKNFDQEQEDKFGELKALRREEGKENSDELYLFWMQSGSYPSEGIMTICLDKDTIESEVNRNMWCAPCYAIVVGKGGVITKGMLSDKFQADLQYNLFVLGKSSKENGLKAMYDLGYYDFFENMDIKKAYGVICRTYDSFLASEYNTDTKSEYGCIMDYLEHNDFSKEILYVRDDDMDFKKFKGFAETYKTLEKENKAFTIDDITFEEKPKKNKADTERKLDKYEHCR